MALEAREGRHPRTDCRLMDQKAVYGRQGLGSEPFAEDTLGDSWEQAYQACLRSQDDDAHPFKPLTTIPSPYVELGICHKPYSLAEQTSAPNTTRLDCFVRNGIFQSPQFTVISSLMRNGVLLARMRARLFCEAFVYSTRFSLMLIFSFSKALGFVVRC